MSDQYGTVSDDVFANFVKQRQEAEAAQAAKQGGGFTGEFEQIKYCAAPKKGHAVVRFVGNPPKDDGTNLRPTDCIERHIAKIKDDQGKIMYLVLPCRADTLEQDHLMWRLISQVKKKEWINKTAVYVNQSKHPDIWEIVTKGGFKPEDGFAYTYADGWDAKRKLLINCIDRSDNWCKENKHTKVFSKNTFVSDTGAEFSDMGVNSYGFLTKLIENITKYGSWERYDSFVMRIGDKTEPFRILNGSAYKTAGMTSELKDITQTELEAISLENSLTDEERSYERYDLEKHFKVSSYQKLLKRLGNSIKKVDAALGSHFYEELIAEAEKEKKANEVEREAKAQIEEQNKIVEAQSAPVATSQTLTNTSGETITTPVQPTGETIGYVAPSFDTMASTPVQPVRREVAPEVPTADFSLLAHFNDLSGAEKSLFRSVVMGENNVPVATFTEDAPAAIPCPNCNFAEPSSVTICANCGAKFA